MVASLSRRWMESSHRNGDGAPRPHTHGHGLAAVESVDCRLGLGVR